MTVTRIGDMDPVALDYSHDYDEPKTTTCPARAFLAEDIVGWIGHCYRFDIVVQGDSREDVMEQLPDVVLDMVVEDLIYGHDPAGRRYRPMDKDAVYRQWEWYDEAISVGLGAKEPETPRPADYDDWVNSPERDSDGGEATIR